MSIFKFGTDISKRGSKKTEQATDGALPTAEQQSVELPPARPAAMSADNPFMNPEVFDEKALAKTEKLAIVIARETVA